MTVLLEGINVLVRVSTLEERYPGGLDGYKAYVPTHHFCADDHLASVAFLDRGHAMGLAGHLDQHGFAFTDESRQRAGDVALVDLSDPTWPGVECDWVEIFFLEPGASADRGAYLVGTVPIGLEVPPQPIREFPMHVAEVAGAPTLPEQPESVVVPVSPEPNDEPPSPPADEMPDPDEANSAIEPKVVSAKTPPMPVGGEPAPSPPAGQMGDEDVFSSRPEAVVVPAVAEASATDASEAVVRAVNSQPEPLASDPVGSVADGVRSHGADERIPLRFYAIWRLRPDHGEPFDNGFRWAVTEEDASSPLDTPNIEWGLEPRPAGPYFESLDDAKVAAARLDGRKATQQRASTTGPVIFLVGLAVGAAALLADLPGVVTLALVATVVALLAATTNARVAGRWFWQDEDDPATRGR